MTSTVRTKNTNSWEEVVYSRLSILTGHPPFIGRNVTSWFKGVQTDLDLVSLSPPLRADVKNQGSPCESRIQARLPASQTEIHKRKSLPIAERSRLLVKSGIKRPTGKRPRMVTATMTRTTRTVDEITHSTLLEIKALNLYQLRLCSL